MTGRSSNTPNVPNSHPKFLPSQSRPKTNYSNYSDKPLVNRQRAATGTTKSMAERINERLAQVAASRIQTDDTNEMEEYSRPFTPTDHALTARPRLEEMGLFKAVRSVEPCLTDDNLNTERRRFKSSQQFKQYFPKNYVNYIEAEPETMQFDQTLATDKVKQACMAKEFITRNSSRMWMFSTDFINKSHGQVLQNCLEAENFPGLMDELRLKERKHLRGTGSEAVNGCLTMKAELIRPDYAKDDFLSTLTESRTSRASRMETAVLNADRRRIKEHNRVSYFKGY